MTHKRYFELSLLAAALGSSTCFADYEATVLEDKPIAFFRFEETADAGDLTDKSGNERGSIEINEIEFGKTGIVGQAAEFFGNSSIVLDLDFDPAETSFSIESWLYTTGVEEIEDLETGDFIEVVKREQVYIAQKDGDGTGRSDVLITADGQLGSYIGGDTTNAFDPFENDPVQPETWYHFVMSYNVDDEELYFHVNGLPSDLNPQFPGANGIESATGEWVIGSHKSQGSQFFEGFLDEIAFYDFQLSDERILAHYKAATANDDAGDFDGDGELTTADIDTLSSAVRDGSNETAFDLNNDGAVDGGDRLEWINVVAFTYLGDSNLDGEFNSSDFVIVFEAGEYEDDIDGNSTWETGDWDGDGDFSSSDFVVSFESGGFEAGPRFAQRVAETVPEPASIVLVLIGSFAILLRRRHP